MASRDPFNIASSPAVAPIPCVECGNNMQCIRRQAMAAGELQLFMCVACGCSKERTVGLQASDDELQGLVEDSFGITRKAG